MFAELLPGDFVCCGTDEFTSPIDFFVFAYLDPRIFGGVQKMTTSGHNIILIGDGCVCVRVSTRVCLLGPHFQWLSYVDASYINIMYVNLCSDIF